MDRPPLSRAPFFLRCPTCRGAQRTTVDLTDARPQLRVCVWCQVTIRLRRADRAPAPPIPSE